MSHCKQTHTLAESVVGRTCIVSDGAHLPLTMLLFLRLLMPIASQLNRVQRFMAVQSPTQPQQLASPCGRASASQLHGMQILESGKVPPITDGLMHHNSEHKILKECMEESLS